ncbi:MAG: tetratricopeptide repeat protein [Asticcacaulis sp.]
MASVLKTDLMMGTTRPSEALPMPQAVRVEAASPIIGDSGSNEALRTLLEATAHIRQLELLTLLKSALEDLRARKFEAAGKKALAALDMDEACATAWHVLGVCREKSGDMPAAFSCYEAAMRIEPENLGVANDIGRLAYFMGLHDNAIKFFAYVLQRDPKNTETINNCASSLREMSRYQEAIDLIRPALEANPQQPALWNTLATVLNAQGDYETGLLFYEEALKYESRNGKTWHNRGLSLGGLGRIDEAIESLTEARKWMEDQNQIEASELAEAFCYFVKGDLTTAYRLYNSRKQTHSLDGMKYMTDLPPLDLSGSLAGKTVFVTAEQGLGDEILFGTILNDLLAELGPQGHLTLAVEPRLVALFKRSFPDVTVMAHRTGKVKAYTIRQYPGFDNSPPHDGFVMMGDLLPRYRPAIADYARNAPFLTPDPVRVSYWQAQLAALGPFPKVGLLWKSLVKHSRRDRYYSPFEGWKPILRTPGVIFVNLQYGDVSEELREMERDGLTIWNPPGIDLKADLDELSALCAALDLIMGPSNATSNIAAAAGTTVWMITGANSWPMLGTDYYPWYPTARMFVTPAQGEWAPGLEAMRQALIDTVAAPVSAPSAEDMARAFQVLDRALLMRDWEDAEAQARALMPIAADQSRTWLGLAMALDRQNRLPEALDAYQRALERDPESLDIAADLAQLAFRIGMYDMAERFYGLIVRRDPGHLTAVNYYAAALCEQSKFDEAIELLKAYLADYPRQSPFWDTLGNILMAQGDPETAEIFFTEAINIDNSLPARFNRACLWVEGNRAQDALPDIEICLDRFSEPSNLRTAELVMAYTQLILGRLDAGWKAYEARHMAGTPKELHVDLPVPRLAPADIAGKRVLIMAEQGLGDELMFATLLPEIETDLGSGSLTLAVEKRLIPLFSKAFPQATVLAHHTETRDGRLQRDVPDVGDDALDGWCFIGDFLPVLRKDVDAFAASRAFLKPDPERVAFWRAELERFGPGLKTGLVWKSLMNTARRRRYYPDFEQLEPLLAAPELVCVNLQYGDSSAEQAEAEAKGYRFYTPPIDLTNDLDELSALCAALDVVVGPANATTQIAAAAGASVHMLLSHGAWVMLGTDHYPWYPNVTPLLPDDSGWSHPLSALATRLTGK